MADERPGSAWFFFLVTFAVTWSCWIPIARWIPIETPLAQALLYLGVFAPALMAVLLTARARGEPGVRALIAQVFQGQVAARWYLFAVLYMASVKILVALIHRLGVGAWPRFGAESLVLIPFAIAISTPVQSGEEVGWRGYALPRLASRLGLGPASIVLGMVWALWHLPLFFVRGSDTFGQPFLVYAAEVVAISVTMAWLWARTGGSLLLPMLLHASINNTKDIVPSRIPGATDVFGLHASPVAWLTMAVLWICAAYFLVSMARRA